MQQIQLPHEIYYPDSHDVSLSDIAATLIAHEKLLPIAVDALERLVPGLTVEDRKIVLDRVEKSSLREAFYVALFIAFQEDLEVQVPALFETITGVPVSDRYDTILTVLFMVALYTGATAMFGRNKKSEAAPASIVGDHNVFINIAADQLGKSPADVIAAVNKAIGNKLSSVQRATVDIFRPAKRNGNGRIQPRGLPEVSPEAVADFPTAVALAELEDDIVPLHLTDAVLHIRATDRDKSDRGWAAKIEAEGVKTRRLPLRLAPGVDPDALAEMHEPRVEAILESRFKEDGTTKPVRIHVFRVIESA
ncbi:hypothetical protein [Brevundimonas sp. GCM10030266]|uniref:hypothetical protein n=1 Tax=Brevundimonas sp. GCM10030266 TaxID=3273386 RepID=UPI00360FC598